jgi:hypothetical protein
LDEPRQTHPILLDNLLRDSLGYDVVLIELFVVELLELLDICSADASCW